MRRQPCRLAVFGDETGLLRGKRGGGGGIILGGGGIFLGGVFLVRRRRWRELPMLCWLVIVGGTDGDY